MKAIYINLIILLTTLVFSACTSQSSDRNYPEADKERDHTEHTLLADNLAHKGIIILDKRHPAPREFGEQVYTLFGSYLDLQNALVKEDTIKANKAADEMKFILDLIRSPFPDMATKHGKAWTNHFDGYMKNLTQFLHVNTLEEKRSYFSHISEILYCTIKSFQMDIMDVHVAYCPMAFENKGAYWLTDEHKIRNPYFGNKMLNCGKIEEIIM